MLTALLSFLGVLIGALLQYFFTRHIENQRHVRELRSKAYMDYLKCVCEHAQLQTQEHNKERQDLFVRTADSKSRICLYGSSTVIQAFSTFEKFGATMGTKEQKEAFTRMISIMRKDSGGEMGVQPADLQTVLLGPRS